MKCLSALLTVVVVFSLLLVGCTKDSVGRERPSQSRELRRNIRELQAEQSALLKEHGIVVDSESRAFSAAIFDWKSKTPQDLATIKTRLKRVQKICNKILKSADQPSLKGKVDVKGIEHASDNAKAYLKSLKDSQKEEDDSDKPGKKKKHSKADDREDDD